MGIQPEESSMVGQHIQEDDQFHQAKTIGQAKLTYDELTIALVEVEMILN